MRFIYNNNGLITTEKTDSQIELENRELPAAEKLLVYEGDFFPYRILESGKLDLDENKNPILLTNSEKAVKGYISLDVIKDDLKKQAKQKEQDAINSGFAFKTHLVDSDPDSQRFISSLLLAVNSGVITEFKGFTTKDNVDIDLTKSDIETLASLCLAHVSKAHKIKRDTYIKIDTANTVSKLKAI